MHCIFKRACEIPEDASKRSSLLTNQSRLSQNRAQLERLPLMREASQKKTSRKKIGNEAYSQKLIPAKCGEHKGLHKINH